MLQPSDPNDDDDEADQKGRVCLFRASRPKDFPYPSRLMEQINQTRILLVLVDILYGAFTADKTFSCSSTRCFVDLLMR